MAPLDRPSPSVLREHPVATAAAAVALLGALRALEVLARVHVRVGALVVSTVAVLVVAAVLARAGVVPVAHLDRTPASFRRAVIVGGVGVAGVQAAAHALEVGALAATGRAPTLAVVAVNPATNSTAPGQVGAYLVFGVAGAAVGQELLFRGVLLGALDRRFPFPHANVLQAVAFGAWHLAWPLAIALADAEPAIPLPAYAVGLVVVTGMIGAVYGVLARATGTLWAPVIAHLTHNLAAVVFHVRMADGTDHGSVLSAGLVAGYAALAWWARERWEG